jgi:hypothetical protein
MSRRAACPLRSEGDAISARSCPSHSSPRKKPGNPSPISRQARSRLAHARQNPFLKTHSVQFKTTNSVYFDSLPSLSRSRFQMDKISFSHHKPVPARSESFYDPFPFSFHSCPFRSHSVLVPVCPFLLQNSVPVPRSHFLFPFLPSRSSPSAVSFPFSPVPDYSVRPSSVRPSPFPAAPSLPACPFQIARPGCRPRFRRPPPFSLARSAPAAPAPAPAPPVPVPAFSR